MNGKARPPEPSRRVQIERLKREPKSPPHPDFGGNLLEYLFELGPVKAESPIEPIDLGPMGWEHTLGVTFEPWQARLLVRMSRAYHREMHDARDWHAPPPWKGAAAQWKWVRAQQSNENVQRMKKDAEASAKAENRKGKARNGDRQ